MDYYIYNMVADTQFHKFHGRPFARVLYLFLMKDVPGRSVTPLGVTRVNRTILLGFRTMLSITIARTDTI